MADASETKRIASRVNVRYIDRPNAMRRWRRLLVLGTFIIAVAGAAWVGVRHARHDDYPSLFNPAPVTLAHARLEHNCAACHVSGGAGTFKRMVTDAACLNCHDAGSHHAGAMLHPGGPQAKQVVSLSNANQAANCILCHVEHRGHEALMSRADSQCIQCHQNLNEHVANKDVLEVGFPVSVTSFPGGHPGFGRRLAATGVRTADTKAGTAVSAPASQPAAGDEAWLPLLMMKFNHRTHVGPDSSARIESCTSCHSTRLSGGDDAGLMALERQSPPQEELKRRVAVGRGLDAAGGVGRGGGVMQPVRYEAHCRACHPLGLPMTPDLKDTTRAMGGASPTTKASVPGVAHDRIEIVRAQLADVDRLYLELLTAPADREQLLKEPKTQKARSVDEWLAEQKLELAEQLVLAGAKGSLPNDVELLAKARAKLAVELRKKKPDQDALDDLKDTIGELLPKARKAIAALPKDGFQVAGELAVTSKNTEGNCTKCHLTEGRVMDAAQFMVSLKEAGEKPFRTLPTRVPVTPRRWFAGSRFDHDKHRDVTCLSCHVGMERDEDGRDRSAGGEVVARNLARLPGIDTCAKCHRPDTREARGAGAACVTCHDFHDRSKERAPGGVLREW